jgi:hypothetical protein
VITVRREVGEEDRLRAAAQAVVDAHDERRCEIGALDALREELERD